MADLDGEAPHDRAHHGQVFLILRRLAARTRGDEPGRYRVRGVSVPATPKKPAEDPDDNLKPPAPRERKEQESDRRREYAEILRSPDRLEKLSNEADRIASWVVDGAKTRLHDRGMRTAHEQFEDAQRAASGSPPQPRQRDRDPQPEPAAHGRWSVRGL